MEALASIIAILGLVAAFIHRFVENEREQRKRDRIHARTNEKPWQRSQQYK